MARDCLGHRWIACSSVNYFINHHWYWAGDLFQTSLSYSSQSLNSSTTNFFFALVLSVTETLRSVTLFSIVGNFEGRLGSLERFLSVGGGCDSCGRGQCHRQVCFLPAARPGCSSPAPHPPVHYWWLWPHHFLPGPFKSVWPSGFVTLLRYLPRSTVPGLNALEKLKYDPCLPVPTKKWMAALEVVGKDRTPVTFQRLAGSFCIIYL